MAQASGPSCAAIAEVPYANSRRYITSWGADYGLFGKMVFASSSVQSPALAFNGITYVGSGSTTAYTDYYRSAAANDTQPWLSVFFTRNYVVTQVRIYNVPGDLSDYMSDLEVRVGTVGMGSLNATGLIAQNELCGTVLGPVRSGEVVTVTCAKPLVGRWATLQKVAPTQRSAASSGAFSDNLANTLAVAEFEVYGFQPPVCPMGQTYDGVRACTPTKPRPIRYLDIRSLELRPSGHVWFRTNDNVYTGNSREMTKNDRWVVCWQCIAGCLHWCGYATVWEFFTECCYLQVFLNPTLFQTPPHRMQPAGMTG